MGGLERKLFFPLLTRWISWFLHLNSAALSYEGSTHSQSLLSEYMCCTIIYSKSYFRGLWPLKEQFKTPTQHHPTSCQSAWHTSWFQKPYVIKKKTQMLQHKSLVFVYAGSHIYGHLLSLLFLSLSSNRLGETKWPAQVVCAWYASVACVCVS